MPTTLRSVLTTRRALSLVAIVLALGASALVFNGAAALPPLIDLGVTPADLTIYGDDAGDQLSFSSASGDINGDTIEDLILGANLAGGSGRPEAGKTYVIYGNASFPAIIDLDATSADVTILGEEAFDQSGYSVAAGDIDGDTIDDVIIGAPGSIFATNGKAHVVYGDASLPAAIDLAASPADLTIIGADRLDRLGTAVAAGDVNDDGKEDVIVGAPQGDGPGTGTSCDGIGDRCDSGEFYIVFGNESLPSTIDLASTSADVTFYGAGELGSALAVGRINDDSVDDFLVAAPQWSSTGRVHVITGRAFLPVHDLAVSSLGSNVNKSSKAVATGDINGDTLDDLLIAVQTKTYVVFSPGSSVDVVISPTSGETVASGDVNGDTTADLLARLLADPGTTWVVFGGAGLPATIDLNSAADLTVLGADVGDGLGSVLAADLNGDTLDDLIIGADHGDGPGSGTACGAGQVGNRCSAGDVYVIFGEADPTPTPMETPTVTLTPTPCGGGGPTCTPSATPTATPTSYCPEIDGDGAVTANDLWIQRTWRGFTVPPAPPGADPEEIGFIGTVSMLAYLSFYGSKGCTADVPSGPSYATTAVTPGPEPGMSMDVTSPGATCDGPKPTKCFVQSGSIFTLSVETDPAPASGYMGFQTQVSYDPLGYKANAECCTASFEVVWPDSGLVHARAPLSPSGLEGIVRHGAGKWAFDEEPSTHAGTILELDFTCAKSGNYTLALPVRTGTNPQGAAYIIGGSFDYVAPASVGTASVDLDGDTSAETVDVADSLEIVCSGPLTPTLTPTPTPTPTLTLTPTIRRPNSRPQATPTRTAVATPRRTARTRTWVAAEATSPTGTSSTFGRTQSASPRSGSGTGW